MLVHLVQIFPMGVFHQISVLTPPQIKKKLKTKTTSVNSSFGHTFECSCILLYFAAHLFTMYKSGKIAIG